MNNMRKRFTQGSIKQFSKQELAYQKLEM